MSITIAGQPLHNCFACGDSFVLNTNYNNTCLACKGFMEQGFICIGITDDAPEHEYDASGHVSYRDGNFCVITKERAVQLALVGAHGMYAFRYAYVRTATWKRLHLPERGKSGANHTSRKGVGDAD